jgi:hypothetical protein
VVAIGCEVVPEVLEVDALAAFDGLLWHLAIEMEVPEVTQQSHILPLPDAGKEGIHQGNPLSLIGILRGVGVGDHKSDVVTDDLDILQAK